MRKALIILFLFIALPVFAGLYETAIANNQKVFLYIYTPSCSYCVKFNPIYNKISEKYGNRCKFLKINATTDYGRELARKFRVTSVPYVVMIDSRKKIMNIIEPSCLIDYACTDSAVGALLNY